MISQTKLGINVSFKTTVTEKFVYASVKFFFGFTTYKSLLSLMVTLKEKSD